MVYSRSLFFWVATFCSVTTARIAPQARYVNATTSTSAPSTDSSIDSFSASSSEQTSALIPTAIISPSLASADVSTSRYSATTAEPPEPLTSSSVSSPYPSSTVTPRNTTITSTPSAYPSSTVLLNTTSSNTYESGNGTATKTTRTKKHTHTPTDITTIEISTTDISTSTTCYSPTLGEAITEYSFVPNTTTITLPMGANATQTPEFTPTPYCCSYSCTTDSTSGAPFYKSTSTEVTVSKFSSYFIVIPSQTRSLSIAPFYSLNPVTTTVVVTVKNPVTLFTSNTVPTYPGVGGLDSKKQTAQVTSAAVPTFPAESPFSTTPSPSPSPTPATSSPGSGSSSGSSSGDTGGGSSSSGGSSGGGDSSSGGGSSSSEGSSGGDSSGSSGGDSSSGGSSGSSGQQAASPTITVTAGSVPIVLTPTDVSIGGQTFVVPTGTDASPTTVVANGQTYTISPSQVIAPGTIIDVPSSQGGVFVATPTPTVIGGASISIGGNIVYIGGSSYTYGQGAIETSVVANGETISIGAAGVGFAAPQTTIQPNQAAATPTPTVIGGASISIAGDIVYVGGSSYTYGQGAVETSVVVNGKTISIGSAGIGFAAAKTTIEPPPAQSTAVIIIGGDIFSAIGSSVAVIGGQTFTYGPGIPQTTDIFNDETITIASNGVIQTSTTLGGTSHPSGTQIGIAGGLSVTEIGSSIVVIATTTFTIGPGASSTTVVINGKTIIVDSSEIEIGTATTLSYPLNPTTAVVTAGGVTFSEIGPSKVVIGGTTYTVGPGAKTTTEVYNSETISIGPDGVGFKTTTVAPASATTTKKSDIGKVKIELGWSIALCIALGVGFLA